MKYLIDDRVTLRILVQLNDNGVCESLSNECRRCLPNRCGLNGANWPRGNLLTTTIFKNAHQPE